MGMEEQGARDRARDTGMREREREQGGSGSKEMWMKRRDDSEEVRRVEMCCVGEQKREYRCVGGEE